MTSHRLTAEDRLSLVTRLTLQRVGNLFVLCLLVFSLIYAPLAYGSTTEATQRFLDFTLYGAVVAFLLHSLAFRQSIHIPGLLWKSGAAVLAFGWFMSLNAAYEFRMQDWTFFEADPALAFLPGSIDGASSTRAMIHITAMIATLSMLCHFCRSRRHRWLLLKTIGVSGFVVALSGLYLKSIGSEQMIWSSKSYSSETFFSMFRYHGHAAAFLNLCWPASLVVLLRSLEKEENHFERAIWINAYFFTVVAVLANTSQAGHLLVLMGTGIAIALFWKRIKRNVVGRVPLLGGIVLLLAVGVIPILPSLHTSIDHWSGFAEDGVGSLQGRLNAYEAGVAMYLDAPVFGMGPGTFHLGFPYYTSDLAHPLTGYWEHLHQDGLQFLIEWGAIGALALLVLVLGGLVRGIRLLGTRSSSRTESNTRDLSTRAAILAVLLVGIHSMIDFPLQIASIQLVLVVYLAILWRVVGKRKGGPLQESERTQT